MSMMLVVVRVPMPMPVGLRHPLRRWYVWARHPEATWRARRRAVLSRVCRLSGVSSSGHVCVREGHRGWRGGVARRVPAVWLWRRGSRRRVVVAVAVALHGRRPGI